MMVLGYPPTEGMLMGIHISGYISESGMTNCGSGSFELLCLWLQLWTWNEKLWLRLVWFVVKACTCPPFSPLSGTRWDDGENSTASLLNIREQVLTCVINIFLAVDAHFHETIHPRWIFFLAGGLFLKHLFEEWVCRPQCLHGWRSKQWSFIWPTRSQCWHFSIYCGSGTGSGTAAGELSYKNPALWNIMGLV